MRLFALRGATMRYTLDFSPLLLMAVLVAWAFWAQRLTVRGARFWSLQALWVLALTASVVFNVALAYTPCQGTGS